MSEEMLQDGPEPLELIHQEPPPEPEQLELIPGSTLQEPGVDLVALAALRAAYFDPLTTGHERERRIRPQLLKYIMMDAYGVEAYHWPEGLDMRGIPDPDPHQQLQRFGRGPRLRHDHPIPGF